MREYAKLWSEVDAEPSKIKTTSDITQSVGGTIVEDGVVKRLVVGVGVGLGTGTRVVIGDGEGGGTVITIGVGVGTGIVGGVGGVG